MFLKNFLPNDKWLLAHHSDKNPTYCQIKKYRWTGSVGTEGRLKSYLKMKRMQNVLAT